MSHFLFKRRVFSWRTIGKNLRVLTISLRDSQWKKLRTYFGKIFLLVLPYTELMSIILFSMIMLNGIWIISPLCLLMELKIKYLELTPHIFMSELGKLYLPGTKKILICLPSIIYTTEKPNFGMLLNRRMVLSLKLWPNSIFQIRLLNALNSWGIKLSWWIRIWSNKDSLIFKLTKSLRTQENLLLFFLEPIILALITDLILLKL